MNPSHQISYDELREMRGLSAQAFTELLAKLPKPHRLTEQISAEHEPLLRTLLGLPDQGSQEDFGVSRISSGQEWKRSTPGLQPALKAFGLGNFKALAETQRLEIKPITLLFGPNSGGKSSLLHGLLYAQSILTDGELDVNRPKLGGGVVDLGVYPQFVHNSDVALGPMVEIEGEPDYENPLTKWEDRLSLRIVIQGVEDANWNGEAYFWPGVSSVELLASKRLLLRMVRRGSSDGYGRYDVEFLDCDYPPIRRVVQNWVTKLQSRKPKKKGQTREGEDPMAHHVTGDVAGDVRRAFEYYVIGWLTATMDFEIETENYDDDEREKPLVKLAQELKRLVQALCDSTRLARQSFCARLSYLAPLRVYPQRDFSVPEAPANEKMAVGSDAWESLAKNKPLREAVNRWFSDLPKSVTATIASYEFDAEERVSLAAVEQLLGKPAQRKSGKSGKNLSPGDMAELRAQSVPRLIMRDSRSGKTLSPRDVGTGISQVVPILVRAFSANARSINLIEQPELHIHPALQAELGDVFIRSALGEQKNRFILETHSEHLILRLLRRIRQSTENAADYPPDLPRLTPDDVSVIYAQPTKVGTKLIPLSITPDGDFADKWPDGFFTERGRELFT